MSLPEVLLINIARVMALLAVNRIQFIQLQQSSPPPSLSSQPPLQNELVWAAVKVMKLRGTDNLGIRSSDFINNE